jgi:A/G-specific adenine glycosylase
MLQQTQMERGVEYFNRWMERFPDIRSLADASEQEVLKAWEGLGYYSRARNIVKAAVLIVEQYDGLLPDEYDQLLALPGIGPYTAGAILSIAFDRPCPVIDANVERLFARLGDVDTPMKEKAVHGNLRELLENMLCNVSPRDFNQGLMEFGALICTPKNPDCADCPVRQHCRALVAGTIGERPVKKKKPQTVDIIMACAIIEHEGKFFIQQRRDDDVWGGLWEFPGGRLKDGESPADAAGREVFEETEMMIADLVPFDTVTHCYTRYRVTLHSFFCVTDHGAKPELHAAQQYRWVSLVGLSRYAFPSGHRQLIARMREMQSEPAEII